MDSKELMTAQEIATNQQLLNSISTLTFTLKTLHEAGAGVDSCEKVLNKILSLIKKI
jgi:hypothetical protein